MVTQDDLRELGQCVKIASRYAVNSKRLWAIFYEVCKEVEREKKLIVLTEKTKYALFGMGMAVGFIGARIIDSL